MGWLSDWGENYVGRLEDAERRATVQRAVKVLLDGGAVILPTNEALLSDLRAYGVHITQDGRRIDPTDFYAPPPEDGPLDSALNKDRTGKHGSEVG